MTILQHIDLLDYNTFHFSCIAEHFVIIKSASDRHELINTEIFANSKKFILGGGSNILLTQNHYDGLVIKNEILKKEIISKTDEEIIIQVGAGENWNDFVLRTLNQGYCGLENLISIPGTVGAAPIQNIGAYGVEVGDLITQVTYFDFTGGTHTLNKPSCQFGYRESIFKHDLKEKVCISSVTFKLQKYHPTRYYPNLKYGSIEDKVHEILRLSGKQYKTPDTALITPTLVAQAITEIRASKMPDRSKIGTAGSFFKNPIIPELQYIALKANFPDLIGHPIPTNGQHIKLSAGQLIDLSGLKGLNRGSVGTYHHHALILIHNGGGSGMDIVKLCHYIQQQVFEKFQVLIEPEVNFI